jgi:anti-anti-sigma factor
MVNHMEGDGEQLTVRLSGELDHHAARELRERIDAEAERGRYKRMVLDFSGLSFMDSSGIGLIMGRYRLMNTLGGTLRVRGASERMDKVMRLAGLDKLGILESAGRAENG